MPFLLLVGGGCSVGYLHLGINQRLSLGFFVTAAAEAHRLPEGDARVAEPLQAVLELQNIPPHQERHRAHGLGARCGRTQAGAPACRAPGDICCNVTLTFVNSHGGQGDREHKLDRPTLNPFVIPSR